MAMSPAEMSAFHAEQAQESMEALDSPNVRNEPTLLEFNTGDAAQNYLMSALIDWRHQFADPRPKLQLALETGLTALETLPSLDSPTPLPARFRFYDIVFVGQLIDAKIPAACQPLIKKCCAAEEVEPRLDYALAAAVLGAPEELKQVIAGGKFSKRQKLLKQTYQTYAQLLAGDATAMEAAESNFLARAKDQYYSGGPEIEGGGPDNVHVIDYRLASIIKSQGMQPNSIHALP